MFRTLLLGPGKVRAHQWTNIPNRTAVPGEEQQARGDALHPMEEHEQVDPGQGRPAVEGRQVGSRQDGIQQSPQGLRTGDGDTIEILGAAALTNQRCRRLRPGDCTRRRQACRQSVWRDRSRLDRCPMHLVNHRPLMPVVRTEHSGLPRPLAGSQSGQQRVRADSRVRFRSHRADQVRDFRFNGSKILIAIHTEKRGNIPIAPVVEQMHPPAQHPGGVAQGGQPVADVVLTVAKGALAIFPCLTPVDGTQAHQYSRKR